MNKYVVGYLSQFDNELQLEIIEANSKVEACIKYLDFDDNELNSMEKIHDYCANCDASINVIQIDKSKVYSHGPAHNPVIDIYLQ